MSAQPTLGFDAPEVDKLPTIICVGRVNEVLEGKLSKSELYINQPIQITGNGANRSTRINFLYRPEWLQPGFKAKTITDSKVMFVYQNNIMPAGANLPRGSRKISVLQGLSGTEERFNDLAQRLLNMEQKDETLITDVRNILHQFFIVEGEDVVVGYKMGQKFEKTGDVDEKGKDIKLPTDNYECKGFFLPNEKALKAWEAQAMKNPERFKVAFDSSTPF